MKTMKVTAAAADWVRPPRRGVVVLLYHRIGGASGKEMDLPRDLFERQMEMLAERGTVASLGEALQALAQPVPPPEDPIVVTFDDGTVDFVEQALPVLDRCKIPATLYLATSFVEHGESFSHRGVPLSWTDVRDALSTGLVTIGSHTHRHLLLDRIDEGSVAEELDRSIELVEDRLGVRPVDFAYPKGVLGAPSAEASVRARFRSAALGGSRANLYGTTDPWRLARSPIQTADRLWGFRRKVEGGMRFEEGFRRPMNRLRYARVTR
jgi:peptidoglycan/xylan/chitin deacetylase (PgdA/CDA1 family)